MREKSNELKTALALLMEGNVQIKNQVADTLKNKFDPKLLGKIETFQNKLIRADQLLVLLRYDLAYVDRLINKGLQPGSPKQKEVHTNLATLRKNVLATETQFGYLKTEMGILLSKTK
jgi:hypothetical protein